MIRNNQNRRRRGGNNNGPRPQQMNGGNNYGNRLDNRQRGNASQLLEKYRALARDAQQAGDRVTAEYYLQYADHYYRVLGDYREKTPADGRQRGQNFYEDDSASYSANGEDGDDGDEEQDGDRAEARAENRGDRGSDDRSDDNRQWRDDRGQNNQDNRPREGQREPRNDQRNEGPRGENRDRQTWNGNSAPRQRDDNRVENRPDRPRDQTRAERPRDENRGDRAIHRDRRPERAAPAEPANEGRPVEARLADEGPIPGLPGPATLRVRRPVEAETAPRAPRALRPEAIVEPALPLIEVAAEQPEGEAAAPRRRGRPRKIVDAAAVDG